MRYAYPLFMQAVDMRCSAKYLGLRPRASLGAGEPRGDGLKPISADLALSMATVKTHLHHVFDKTDTPASPHHHCRLLPDAVDDTEQHDPRVT